MTKHKDKKNQAEEIKKDEVVETTTTNETTEEPTTEQPEEEETAETEEIDQHQFALDMMQAFNDSTDKLRSMKTQFNFPEEHYISKQVAENERLQAIIAKLNPNQ